MEEGLHLPGEGVASGVLRDGRGADREARAGGEEAVRLGEERPLVLGGKARLRRTRCQAEPRGDPGAQLAEAREVGALASEEGCVGGGLIVPEDAHRATEYHCGLRMPTARWPR